MFSFSLSRRASIISAALIALCLVGYVLYWNHLSDELQTRYNSWIELEAKSGGAIKGEVTRGGFPFQVSLNVKDFSFDKDGFARITAPYVQLALRPWSPFRVTANAYQGGTFFFTKLDYGFSAQGASVSMARPLFRPRSMRNNGLFVNLSLEGVGLDERQKVALGNFIQSLSFRAKVKGILPDVSNKAEVDTWRKDGGTVELDRINLVWGSLSMTGKGTLALDKDFQPQAAFSTTVYGYEQAVDVMRDQGQLKPLVASIIKAALKMLEDEEANSPSQTIRVPVTIQNNGLSVAGVNITSWAPYPWP